MTTRVSEWQRRDGKRRQDRTRWGNLEIDMEMIEKIGGGLYPAFKYLEVSDDDGDKFGFIDGISNIQKRKKKK